MSKFYRKAVAVAVTLLMFASVAGCAGEAAAPAPDAAQPESQNAAPAAESESAPADEPEAAANPADITASIKIWGAIQAEQGPLDLIAHFNELYPNISVEYVMFKNDDAGNTKLNTALMSNEGVDVFINYDARRMVPRVRGGLTEDLTPYIERDGFNMEENFGDANIAFEDGVFALPASSIKTMVWINKAMLDAAGLPVPEDDWTWDDFEAYISAMSTGSGADKVFGSFNSTSWFGATYPARGLLGTNYLYKEDGTSNFDHPAFRDSLVRRFRVQNELKIEYDMIEMLTSKMQHYEQFLTGRSAMMTVTDAHLRHANNLKDYPRDWQIIFANIPRYDEAADVNYNKGRYTYDFISVNSKSENKDAAWALAKFWATEGSADMFRYGRAPAWTKTDIENASEFMFTDETRGLVDMDSFKRVFLDFASEGYNDDHFVAYDQIVDIFNEELQNYQLGDITVDEALQSMKQRADEEIQKELDRAE